MIVRDAHLFDVVHVTYNMRKLNADETFALRFKPTFESVGAELIARAGADNCIKCFALCNDAGEPVALAGAWLVAPGVATVHLVATDKWLTVSRAAYRWIKREFIPFVLEPNVRRAETRVMDRGIHDRAWLHRLGFMDEGHARKLGRNGEDFVYLAWINRSA